MLPIYREFETLVVENIPLIDVRAPIEFQKGSFPRAVNLPLMNDEERHLVGICYKKKGREEAVKLGHELVSGEINEKRIERWVQQVKTYPDSVIYCFRGGLRSMISQQWIYEATGLKIPRLEGGYKAFRQYLISQLDPSNLISKPVLISGYTGAGKTELLKKLPNAIDLEGIANHRGSAFGGLLTPQPTQIDFENRLAYQLIQHRHKGYRYMILEDEGNHIGKCYIPNKLASHFKSGDVVIVETPFEQRVQNTMDEYVCQAQRKYMEKYSADQGLLKWADDIRNSLHKIRKRLGGVRFKKVSDRFEEALQIQLHSGSCSFHKNWIETLLLEYYDPMYEYKMKNLDRQIILAGDATDVATFLKSECL